MVGKIIIAECEDSIRTGWERLPDLNDWQTFNREMDAKLRRCGYKLKWSALGQSNPRAAESRPEFERARQQLLARLIQPGIAVIAMAIVVLLLDCGIARLAHWLEIASEWIQGLWPGLSGG